MIGKAAEDGPGAAAMIDTGPEVPPVSAILGDQKAPDTLGPTVDIDGAEATKMKSTEVPPMTTRGHSRNQAHVATRHPAPLHPPDPGPRIKRAGLGPTAQLKTPTQPPAPGSRLWEDLHPAPSPGPCPGHVLAPGPGLDASWEVTDSPPPFSINFVFKEVFVQVLSVITRVLCSMFTFICHYILEELFAKGKRAAGAEIFSAL